jgi:hypothetical protein
MKYVNHMNRIKIKNPLYKKLKITYSSGGTLTYRKQNNSVTFRSANNLYSNALDSSLVGLFVNNFRKKAAGIKAAT